MTFDKMLLADLIEQVPDGDLLKILLTQLLNGLMHADVENITQAGYGERTDERANSRNGYRKRAWNTTAGSIELAIPKLRKGCYMPPFLEARRLSDKALMAVVQEAYIGGMSTRSVEAVAKAMGITSLSKSQVSRLCEDIDERVHAFLSRPIEGQWPYLWIDATYVKVRQGGRIVSVAVIIAVGVNADGRREVLGIATGASEAEPFWTAFLRSLTARGLRGVKLVISDAHLGIKAAVAKVFSATWQRCRIHFMRNAGAHVGAKQQGMVFAAIKTIFAQESEKEAQAEWDAVADRLRPKFGKLAALMDEAKTDVLAYMGFPKAHWTQIHSTNPIERLNREVKRRSNVVSIFPNEAAIIRLVGALMIEHNDEWAVSRRYMSLETLAGLCDKPNVSAALPAA